MPHRFRARPRRPGPRPLRSFFLAAAVALAAAAPARAQTAGAAGEVRLIVTVTDDEGRYLTGLNKSQFSVLEGKAAREITAFDSADAPASVAVLFDASGSVDKKNLNAARFALVRFLQLSNPANEYFIAEFSSRFRVLTGWTRDAKALADALNKIGGAELPGRPPRPGGGTAIYDACDAALESLAAASSRKRVLLLLTDGGLDNASRSVTRKGLSRKLKETGALFYAVAARRRAESPSAKWLLDHHGLAELKELAGSSGGNVLTTDTLAGLYEAVERVAVELRNQYLIGFRPANAAGPGKWNKVRIGLAKPEGVRGPARVRSRGGYFSGGAAAGDP